MPRIVVAIGAAVLRGLKRLQRARGKTLGQLISELVTAALVQEAFGAEEVPPFAWKARPMCARIDLEDKEAVRAALASNS